jgi:hypothetical protein
VSLCYLKINLMWLTTRVACHNIYMYKSHPLGTPPPPRVDHVVHWAAGYKQPRASPPVSPVICVYRSSASRTNGGVVRDVPVVMVVIAVCCAAMPE